jgi:REP element-mobilizing transposase RayT
MALAIFTTWTTYGTWLPGDGRGWVQRGAGTRDPNPLLELAAQLRMTATAVRLTDKQREIVEPTIINHCAIRTWQLLAANCRTNHVHVLVGAEVRTIETPREQFKAWCTRKLKPTEPSRTNWWTERGRDEYVDDEDSLERVKEYIRNQ